MAHDVLDILSTDLQEVKRHETGMADLKLIGKLWPYMRTYKKPLIIALILLPLIAASDMALPFIMRAAIDGPIRHGNIPGLVWFSLAFLGVMIVNYGVRYWQLVISQRTGQLIIRDLRTDLYRHFQDLGPRFYQTHPLGKLITRLTSDIENLSEMLSSGGFAILADIAVILGMLTGMFLMEWRLALITVAMMGLLFWVMEFFRRRTRWAYDEIRVKVARMNAFLQENITGMELVRLYRREGKNFRHFDALNHSNLKSSLDSILYSTGFNAVVEFFTLCTLVLILWVAGVAIVGGDMTYGVLAAFFLFISKLFEPVEDLSEKYTIIQSGLSSVDKVMALFAEQPEIVDRQPQAPVVRAEGDIRFDNVVFGYNPENAILKGIDFQVRPGERIAIVGPSGAGKTTLLKLLLRFYDVDAGSIRLDGKDVREWPLHSLRQNIVAIQQDDFLFSRSLAENIALAPYAPDMEARLWRAVEKAHARRLVERYPQGFQHVLEERGRNLSAGERQLILFARAFYHDPAILILDEATSAIDSITEELVQEAMTDLMRNRTVLIVAHRLSTIESADRIIVMEQGEVAQIGTHTELVQQSGLYQQFFEYQKLATL